VVKVSGLIHQLYVGEAEEENGDSKSVLPTQHYHCGRNKGYRKKCVGPVAQRLDPLEVAVTEKVIGLEVKFFNPTVPPETQNAQSHQQAEANAEGRQWSRGGSR